MHELHYFFLLISELHGSCTRQMHEVINFIQFTIETEYYASCPKDQRIKRISLLFPFSSFFSVKMQWMRKHFLFWFPEDFQDMLIKNHFPDLCWKYRKNCNLPEITPIKVLIPGIKCILLMFAGTMGEETLLLNFHFHQQPQRMENFSPLFFQNVYFYMRKVSKNLCFYEKV